MGLITFDGFKAELRTALGRNLTDPPINRWVNFGYYELCSDVDFEVLDAVFNIVTAPGVREYAYTPVSTPVHLGIKVVWDETLSRKLDFMPKQAFYGLEPYAGNPDYWTLDRDRFIVYPTPVGGSTLRVVYKKPPTALSAGGDQTILPATWDRAVVLASAKHGFYMVDEYEKAALFAQEYARYISSRITEDASERKMMEAMESSKISEKKGAA